MNNNTEAAIQFKNVHYKVEDLHILKNISGSIPKGKITTLVGPSGAGKTSLLKMCNGLASPTSGDIFIHNKPITSIDPPSLRRHVGIALQSAPMIKGTVYNNIALPLKLQEQQLSEQDAIRFLENVGLEKRFLHHNSDDLSGGQRQKVSIARTLVNKSEILLLDEITSALDRNSVQEIEELILKINRDFHVTIIWITHNLEQAKRTGDFTWIMINGELIETGTTDILTNPKNEQARQFLSGGIL